MPTVRPTSRSPPPPAAATASLTNGRSSPARQAAPFPSAAGSTSSAADSMLQQQQPLAGPSSLSSSTSASQASALLAASAVVPAAATGRNATRTRRSRRPAADAVAAHIPPEDHPLSADKLAARGYYTFQCLGVPFHVHQRYRFIRELGIGAYGCVALCRDEVLDCNVAIKKVTRIFDRDVLARRALREVAILRHLSGCDNVTTLLDFDASFVDFAEVYFVLSASEADLSQIIRSGQGLSDAHLQYFMAQILRGTRYLHSANVIHRDLKPGNLLVNADCALRICDFGLARAYAESQEGNDEQQHPRPATPEGSQSSRRSMTHSPMRSPTRQQSPEPHSPDKPRPDRRLSVSTSRLDFPGGPLTDYVATRWYRAPEIMLCLKDGYGPEIDMWSIGCILAELISGQPIFPGKDYVDQIARINNVLGAPSEATIAKIGSERARTYLLSLPKRGTTSLEHMYPNASPDAIDLLSKMLTWDPEERISAAEALQHPWLKAYHRSNANWTPPQPFSRFADVEFIKTLPAFRAAFDLQASEIRAENERADQEVVSEDGSSDISGDDGLREAEHEGTNGRRPSGERGCDVEDEHDGGAQGVEAPFVSSSSSSGTSSQSHLAPTPATSAGTSIATPCSSALGDDMQPLSPGMYPRKRERSSSGDVRRLHADSLKEVSSGLFGIAAGALGVRRRGRGTDDTCTGDEEQPTEQDDEAVGAAHEHPYGEQPSEWLGIDEKLLQQPFDGAPSSSHHHHNGSGESSRRRTRSHSFSRRRGDAGAGGVASGHFLSKAVTAVTPLEDVAPRARLRSESGGAERCAIAV